MIPTTGERERLPELDVEPPVRQSRVTVFFRLLLAIPHFVVLFFLGIAQFFVAIVGWFAALFTGRLPEGIRDFLIGVLGWETRVGMYVALTVDRYPPFSFEPRGHPVAIDVGPPTPLNRVAVFFRFILVIPAWILMGLLTSGWWSVSFIIWLIVLILGRMPAPLFEATAAIGRASMRTRAYFGLMTPAYPKGWFGDPAAGPRMSATRPLVLSTAAKALMVIFIVLGVASGTSQSTVNRDHNGDDATTTSSVAP
ncbi:DUF4389 domain-containing protein [Actinomadura parmotrematis]|uniref:DUF4389 domain-containing protein n=1 Tax=Actinomadura parmotrematis TaxID=2864039 RepID=A0ABS7FXG9_9ACTN|nr:DUF4389 domain-containing protein [Actinomadura parmotrematis]MBW8485129.1 DUF4389 domain-containing protein [Actinomadura parmotrematis]